MTPGRNYSAPFESCPRSSPRCGPVSLWPQSGSYVPTSTAGGCGTRPTRNSLRLCGSSAVILRLRPPSRAAKRPNEYRGLLLDSGRLEADVVKLELKSALVLT